MNPARRKAIAYLVVSAALAFLVVVVVVAYVGDVNRRVGERVTVYRAASAVPAYTPLSDANLEAVKVPLRWTDAGSRLSLGELRNRRVGFALSKGTVITRDMLLPTSDLAPTQREVAINVSAETGIGGRVQPGSFVDVYAVFGDVPGLPKQVRILVRNVRVVSVSGRQSVQRTDDDTGVRSQQAVVPVTLALEANDALAVAYAGAFADEVRLVGLPTDDTVNRSGEADEFDAGDLGGTPVPEGAR